MKIILPIYGQNGAHIGYRVAKVVRPPLVPVYGFIDTQYTRVINGELKIHTLKNHKSVAVDFTGPEKLTA